MATDGNDFEVLVKAVERYVQKEEYPTINGICAILGIEYEEKA